MTTGTAVQCQDRQPNRKSAVAPSFAVDDVKEVSGKSRAVGVVVKLVKLFAFPVNCFSSSRLVEDVGVEEEEDTGEDPIKARCAQKSARREQESRQGRRGQSRVANLRRRWRAAVHNLSEHGVLQEPKVVVHDGLDSAVRCTTGYIV